MFIDKTLSNSSDFYYLELGIYPSITDVVEAMNALIQKDTNTTKNVSQLKVLEER